MLPSFRLIAVTFLCGFLVVFAGLRLAASLNDMHEGLPVMAAYAAPVSIARAAERETRRSLSPVPMMYDLRFAVSTVSPTLVRVTPTILERATPAVALPEVAAEPSDVPSRVESTFAAIPSEAPAMPAAPIIPPDVAAETAKPQAPAVAAIDIQADTKAESQIAEPGLAVIPPAAEIPAAAAKAEAIEPPAPAASEATAEPLLVEPDTTASIEAPAEAPTALAPDSAAVSAAPDPVPDPAPAAAVEPPVNPSESSQAALSDVSGSTQPVAVSKSPVRTSVRHAKPKIAQKKRIRIARRPPAANTFGTFNNTPATPFGGQ